MLKDSLIERRFTHIKRKLTQIRRKSLTHNLRLSALDSRKSALTNIFNLRNGQTLLEYVILVSIVAAAIIAMSPALKRGIHSVIKVSADQLAPQSEAEQEIDSTSGYLVDSFSSTRFAGDKLLEESPGGKTKFTYDDLSEEKTQTLTNLGFTNRID